MRNNKQKRRERMKAHREPLAEETSEEVDLKRRQSLRKAKQRGRRKLEITTLNQNRQTAGALLRTRPIRTETQRPKQFRKLRSAR